MIFQRDRFVHLTRVTSFKSLYHINCYLNNNVTGIKIWWSRTLPCGVSSQSQLQRLQSWVCLMLHLCIHLKRHFASIYIQAVTFKNLVVYFGTNYSYQDWICGWRINGDSISKLHLFHKVGLKVMKVNSQIIHQDYFYWMPIWMIRIPYISGSSFTIKNRIFYSYFISFSYG